MSHHLHQELANEGYKNKQLQVPTALENNRTSRPSWISFCLLFFLFKVHFWISSLWKSLCKCQQVARAESLPLNASSDCKFLAVFFFFHMTADFELHGVSPVFLGVSQGSLDLPCEWCKQGCCWRCGAHYMLLIGCLPLKLCAADVVSGHRVWINSLREGAG